MEIASSSDGCIPGYIMDRLILVGLFVLTIGSMSELTIDLMH